MQKPCDGKAREAAIQAGGGGLRPVAWLRRV